jgi:hypothetical protein
MGRSLVFLMLEFVGLGMSGTFVEESRCRDWWGILNGSGGPALSKSRNLRSSNNEMNLSAE